MADGQRYMACGCYPTSDHFCGIHNPRRPMRDYFDRLSRLGRNPQAGKLLAARLSVRSDSDRLFETTD